MITLVQLYNITEFNSRTTNITLSKQVQYLLEIS